MIYIKLLVKLQLHFFGTLIGNDFSLEVVHVFASSSSALSSSPASTFIGNY